MAGTSVPLGIDTPARRDRIPAGATGRGAGSGGTPAAGAAGGRSAGREAAAPEDPGRRVVPARVERPAGLVDVEHERRVIGRNRLALARLAVDLDRDDPRGD